MNGIKCLRRCALCLSVSALLLAETIFLSGPVAAQEGANVVAGSASITQSGSALNVITQSDRTIINWDSFSINAGQTANFLQPNAQSAVLNRVITNNPSLIYGNLNSNGNVILVNPSGIMVGPSGVINTNGFTASVFDIPDLEFLQGGSLHFRGDSTAKVINDGMINTGTGGAALIGGDVINKGTITSFGGSISLATGGSVTLADGSRFTHADLNTIEMGLSPYAGVIRNSGTIRATGALEAGGEVYLVNPSGNILHNGTISSRIAQADGSKNGGKVSIDAGQGIAKINGQIDATGQHGGRVTVEGERVLLSGATIDVSGNLGGGFANLGGGYQGADPSISNAQITTVDANSIIRADALTMGDGGQVIIWADDSTMFEGTISARGGILGGDGGFIETSGGRRLGISATAVVDALAANGNVGDWLLDPQTVFVAIGGTATLAQIADASDTTSELVVDPSTINNALANVFMVATERITFFDPVSITASGVGIHATAGEIIEVGAPVTTNNGDITFISDDFAIGANVNVGTGTILFDRATPGRFAIGNIPSTPFFLDLNIAELGRLTAGSLVIGDPDPSQNNISILTLLGTFDLSTNIAGRVQLNAVSETFSYIDISGPITFQLVEFNANDGVTVADGGTVTTTVGSIVLNVDADELMGFGGSGDLRSDGGVAEFNSAANIAVIASAYNEVNGGTLALNADNGAGIINFQRNTPGTIGVGSGAAGGLNFDDDELSRMTALRINFINLMAPNLTTGINVNQVDLTSVPNVNFFNSGTTTFTGANNFAAVSTNSGTTVVDNGASIDASNTIAFNSPTVNLDGNLTATNGISGLATVIDVLGSAGGAELQDAIDVAVAGATINVAPGSYAQFVIDKPMITVDGVGPTSIVNASGPAITIAANGATVQDLLLQGTGNFGEIGILLAGRVSPELTGISIVNVDMSNLDAGILSRGDIGTGVATDVLISGNSAADRAIFEDFLSSALILGDTDGDAIYSVQDVIVRDGSTDANRFATGDDGFQFLSIGGLNIQRVDISGATTDGIQFGAIDDAVVNILDSSIVGGLDDSSVSNGLNFTSPISNGSQVTIAGNSQIVSQGGMHGIWFDGSIIGATTQIDIANNTLIQGIGGSGIVIERNVTDATFIVRGNGTDMTNGIRGLSDAIAFKRGGIGGGFVSLTNANVLIGGDTAADGNFLFSLFTQSIDVEKIIGGTFTVANNTLRNEDTFATSVEFEQAITNNATVQLINNNMSGPAVGVFFLNNITDSNVILAGNDINLANVNFGNAILFRAGPQITDSNVTIGSANVMVDGNAIAAGGNTLVSGGNGVAVFSQIFGSSSFSITDNQIGTQGTPVGLNGIFFGSGIFDMATVTISGSNQVFATGSAIHVIDLRSSSPFSVTGGTYSGIDGGGLFVDNRRVAVANGRLNIGAATFSTGTSGTAVEILSNSGLGIHFGSPRIDGGDLGLQLFGPGIGLVNDSFGNITFNNQTAVFIELANGALFEPGQPTVLDATGVNFDGLSRIGQDFNVIMMKIIDFNDDPTLGLIFPGAFDAQESSTYDRFTRDEDYFRTIGALLGPNAGTIRYPVPRIEIAEELARE